MESPFMHTEELAEFLKIPVKQVKAYATREPHRLPPRFSKPGQRLLWHRDDVTEWVERQRRESKARALSQLPRVGNIRMLGRARQGAR
jgi:hypothetical protein